MRRQMSTGNLIKAATHLTFLFVLTFNPVMLGSSLPQKVNGNAIEYSERYLNRVYGYEIRIPEGLRGIGNAPPNPDHGVRIYLKGSKSYIWVDAYFEEESQSFSQILRGELSEWRSRCNGIRRTKQSNATMGELKAARMEFTCDGRNNARIEMVVGLRLREGNPAIHYEIGLEQAANELTQAENHHAILESIRRSFKLSSPQG